MRYCKQCGSKLGIDCGNAEPDYNDEFCSEGCYTIKKKYKYIKKMRTEFIELSDSQIEGILSGEIVTDTIRVNGEVIKIEVSNVRDESSYDNMVDYHYDLNKNQ